MALNEWQLLGSLHQGPIPYDFTLCYKDLKKPKTFSVLENSCERLRALPLSAGEIRVTTARIVPLPLSFITYACVDWCKTTMLLHTGALYSNNNSAAYCSYSALDVYPTNPYVYAQYPVVWNTSTRRQLGKITDFKFLGFNSHRSNYRWSHVHSPGSCGQLLALSQVFSLESEC